MILVRIYCPACGERAATVERLDRAGPRPQDGRMAPAGAVVVKQRAVDGDVPRRWQTWRAPWGWWGLDQARPAAFDCGRAGCSESLRVDDRELVGAARTAERRRRKVDLVARVHHDD